MIFLVKYWGSLAHQAGSVVVVYSGKNVREQRFRVGYWVVTYIFSLSFTLSEKNLLIVRISIY